MLTTVDGIAEIDVEFIPDWGFAVREYVGDVLVALAVTRPDLPDAVFAQRWDGPDLAKPRTFPTHVEYPQGDGPSRMIRADGWVEARRLSRHRDYDGVTGWVVRGLTDLVDDPRVYRNKTEALAALLAWEG